MAERRMFAKTIIDSDAFLDMPISTQALYFHLGMRADDDGFLNNPKKIQRIVGASDDDLKLLIAKNFIIMFKSGVVVIKHWRIHNYIQNDRYKPTVYTEEKALLTKKNNNAYTLDTECIQGVSVMDTECIQDVSTLETQVRLGKDSIGKDRLGKDKEEEPPAPAREQKHKHGEYNNVLLTDTELDKLKEAFPDYEEKIDNLSRYIESKGAKYKSHYATILNWARRDAERGYQQRPMGKPSAGEELDRAYAMMADWAESGGSS